MEIENRISARAVFIAASLIVSLTACGGEPEASPSPENTETATPEAESEATNKVDVGEEPARPTIEVTAEELFEAYQANEAAAQMKYGKATLIVSGEVDGVRLDFADDPVVGLKTSNMFMSVGLHDVSSDVASNISKGQFIKAKCEKVGEVIGSPQLDGCEIL